MALRTGPSQRTAAERAAIDARADAYPRPLSATQIRALKILASPVYSHALHERAGWTLVTLRPLSSTTFPVATIHALSGRGLARILNFDIRITPAGRRELARHR